MSIALMVFKFLLFFLLALLVLFFIFVIFLLFFPFRYRIKGKKDREEPKPDGELSLCFPGFRIRLSYNGGDLSYQCTVLFLTVAEGGKE